MDRNDRLSEEIVRYAARQMGVNPEGILAMARARTMPGPVRDGWERDLTHEALEELADAINYGPWEVDKQQQLGAPGLAVAQAHFIDAIGHAVASFEAFVAAREALPEACNKCGWPMLPQEGEFIPVLVCSNCNRQVPR